MKNNRRKFLKIAGAAALGLGLGKATSNPNGKMSAPISESESTDSLEPGHAKAVTSQPVQNLATPPPATAKQWGMVIDTRMLKTAKDREPLIKACEKIHNIPKHNNKKHEIKWIWNEEYKHAFPSMENKYVAEDVAHRPMPVLCNHCENPSCVRACPTKATFKRKDGIVLMDFHRCIGCRFCMAACPYGSRSFNYIDPRPAIKAEDYNPKFPTRTIGVVEKCNFCAERLAQGKWPACVEASKGALTFGDLEDPQSDIRKVLKSNFTIRRNPSLGTGPAVYYII